MFGTFITWLQEKTSPVFVIATANNVSALPPELLRKGRFDEIFFCDLPDREDRRQIIDIQLQSLLRRLEDRKLRLTLSDRARDLLVEEGYDPVYGARPLKRTLQRQLLDPLARAVLQGDFHEGDVVDVDLDGGTLTFARRTGADAAPTSH